VRPKIASWRSAYGRAEQRPSVAKLADTACRYAPLRTSRSKATIGKTAAGHVAGKEKCGRNASHAARHLDGHPGRVTRDHFVFRSQPRRPLRPTLADPVQPRSVNRLAKKAQLIHFSKVGGAVTALEADICGVCFGRGPVALSRSSRHGKFISTRPDHGAVGFGVPEKSLKR
jgi:hypothetical protein